MWFYSEQERMRQRFWQDCKYRRTVGTVGTERRFKSTIRQCGCSTWRPVYEAKVSYKIHTKLCKIITKRIIGNFNRFPTYFLSNCDTPQNVLHLASTLLKMASTWGMTSLPTTRRRFGARSLISAASMRSSAARPVRKRFRIGAHGNTEIRTTSLGKKINK